MSAKTLGLGSGVVLLLLLASLTLLPFGPAPPVAEMANMVDAISFSWPSSSSSAELASIEEANRAYANLLSQLDGMVFSSDGGINEKTIAGTVAGLTGVSYEATYSFDPDKCKFDGKGSFTFPGKAPIFFFVKLSSCNLVEFVEEFMNKIGQLVTDFKEVGIPFSSYWKITNQMIFATMEWIATLLPEMEGKMLLQQFKLFFELGEVWFGQLE